MEVQLLVVLRKNKNAIASKVADIRDSPSIVMHKILMEDCKPKVQPQRHLNLAMQEVVRKEAVKLLDASIIYPISNNASISSVKLVPKKGGMIVIKNVNNELIFMRAITSCS